MKLIGPPKFYRRKSASTGEHRIGVEFAALLPHRCEITLTQIEELIMAAFADAYALVKAAQQKQIADLTTEVSTLKAQVPDAADQAAMADVIAQAAALSPAPPADAPPAATA